MVRSAIEEKLGGVKKDVTHSVWPWIAEQAGFLLTRFEVGLDGKTAYERLERSMSKGTRLVIRGRNPVEEETSRRPAWKDDVRVGRWRARQPREKSSWRTEMAFGSQERSGGSQRRKDGTEAMWR